VPGTVGSRVASNWLGMPRPRTRASKEQSLVLGATLASLMGTSSSRRGEVSGAIVGIVEWRWHGSSGVARGARRGHAPPP